MKIEMHPLAVDFRHIMRDELKNWRMVNFHPGAYRIDDWPRYRDQSPLGPGKPIPENQVRYFDFADRDVAQNYMTDLAISHALRETAKLQLRRLRAENRKKAARKAERARKGWQD